MVTVAEGRGSFCRLDHVTVPLPDGTCLAARIWIPDNAYLHPVPAVLEYIPYRKNDLSAVTMPGRPSVRIWLPGGATDGLAPVILEYVPCRKNGLVLKGASIHTPLIDHGYVSVRIDLKTSGSSDGIIDDDNLSPRAVRVAARSYEPGA